MPETKRILVLLLITVAVTLIVGGIAVGIFYETAYQRENARLIAIVQGQARLIEAVARFDRKFSGDYLDGSGAATLSQIRDAHENYPVLAGTRTGEFTLARREGDTIHFVLNQKLSNFTVPDPVPFRSDLAEPMSRALAGQSGVMVGNDYRDVTVLAAYEPVAVLDLGVVAKIDLAEIRAPFLKASGFVSVIGTAAMVLGAILFFRVSNPLVRQIWDSEERFRQLAENIDEVFWMTDARTGRILYISPAYERIWGRDRQTIYENPAALRDSIHPEDRDRDKRSLFKPRTKGRTFDEEFRILRPDREIRSIRNRGFPVRDKRGNVYRIAGIAEDITERKRAEAINTRLGRIVEQSLNEIYMFDAQTLRFIQVNRGARENLGYSMEELHELTPLDIKPEYTEELYDELLSPLLNRTSDRITFETIHKRKDGSVYDVELRLQLMHTETPPLIVAIAQDITERKKLEKEVRDSWAHISKILETVADGIISIDENGLIVSVNPATELMFGYARHEMEGKNVTGLMPERYRAEHVKSLSRYLSTGSPSIVGQGSVELTGQRKDGSSFPLELVVNEMGGKPRRFVSTVRDITKRKEEEEQRKEIEDHLLRAQKMEAIGTLSSGIAHDFNNMLVPIIGLTKLVMEDLPEASQAHRNLQNVLQAAGRATGLVQKILTFAQSEEPERKPIRIHEIIHESLDFLRTTIPATITIENSIDAGTGTLLADSTQMQQVVINLTVNAAHAIGTHVGVIDVKLRQVEISALDARRIAGLKPGRAARLTIRDTGCGMSQETLARIFDPFFTTKETGEGTGLGLSTVHGIVTAHEGAITVSSEPGVGTSFDIYLPLMDGDEAAAADGVRPRAKLREKPKRRRREDASTTANGRER